MNHRRERWGVIAYNPKTVGGFLGLGKEALGSFVATLVSGKVADQTVAEGLTRIALHTPTFTSLTFGWNNRNGEYR